MTMPTTPEIDSRRRRPPKGGLAPWQERRVKELITDALAADHNIRDLSAVCDLSPTHFARAFRQTTGVPPYQWLLRQRVATARRLLSTTREDLSGIAAYCGFADQSHFTRVFTKVVGKSPGAWRRNQSS